MPRSTRRPVVPGTARRGTAHSGTARRAAVVALAPLTLALAACSGASEPTEAQEVEGEDGTTYNLTADQERPRSTESPEAVAALPADVAEDGVLTVSTTPADPPLNFYATDNETLIGSSVDIAQLVADALGLELEVVGTSWESWPLAIQSGEAEVEISYVGVTDERKELFDFVAYSSAQLSFVVNEGSDVEITEPADISGLTVGVTAGTNQERILLAWNEDLEAQGVEPAQVEYYKTVGDMDTALTANRIDATFRATPQAAYAVQVGDGKRLAGTFEAGWPETTYVGAATNKGNGLAEALQPAFEHIYEDGTFAEVLEKWGQEDEALDAPVTNPEV